MRNLKVYDFAIINEFKQIRYLIARINDYVNFNMFICFTFNTL